MSTWLLCDIATKAIVTFGMSPTPEMASMQTVPEGQSLIVLPDGLLGNAFGGALDLSRLKATMISKVNGEAETVRLQFITPGAGKMMSYLEKRNEAAAWTANHSASVPIITAEAAATGKTVAAVVTEIQTAAAMWVMGEAMINAVAAAANKAITDADNVPDIVTSASIDWAALAAQIPAGG